MTLMIKTAEELIDPELEARWARRRADRQSEVLWHIWRAFLTHGGPIPVEAIERAFTGRSAEAVRDTLVWLDEHDLVLLQDGHVRLAYPFSGAPTAFSVTLPAGAERFACCAIDALGIAPMLGHRIEIRARCHHCGTPLLFSADTAGPGPDADGVMVWVGRRGPDERRVCTGY